MGLYLYQHPVTQEIKEVFQNMNDIHVYAEDGVSWNRVFVSPQTAVDTQWDINSSRNFIEQSAKKKGKIGDLMDKSAELSQKRQEKFGIDPVKEKYYQNYSKVRKGKEHPDVLKKNTQEKISKFGFDIG